MPSFRIGKNGSPICTAGSEGLKLVDVRVAGDVWGPEPAHLDITGSRCADDGSHDFLVWEMLHNLSAGETIAISFCPESTSSQPGKVFDDEAEAKPKVERDWSHPPSESEIQQHEVRPKLVPQLAFVVSVPGEPPIIADTADGRHMISFSVSWADHRPDQARVSLSTCSLREALSRTGGRDFMQKWLPIGSEVTVSVRA